MKLKPVYTWTWKIKENGKWVLCRWSMPTKESLEFDGKPSPEAVAIRVTLST